MITRDMMVLYLQTANLRKKKSRKNLSESTLLKEKI